MGVQVDHTDVLSKLFHGKLFRLNRINMEGMVNAVGHGLYHFRDRGFNKTLPFSAASTPSL